MSATEPKRPELPPPNRDELAMAPTQVLRPEEPSSQLASLLDDYLAELQAGRQPDRAKLLAEHPELAAQLENCLSGIEFIHRASAPTPARGLPTQLGDFRIVREVGRGGMGVVYEAEQISLKRRVALKVLRFGAASDTEAMKRFQREAETVAGLHHTNIVPIFAIGCEQGVNYYAMQFIEGRSLNVAVSLREMTAERLSTSDARPDTQQHSTSTAHSAIVSRSETATKIAGWGLQAAEALAHAHQRGVIHRDIKPSNLILDPDGRIWLTDFGLAKRMDDVSLSMAGAILGTPRYMSPEQAAASKNPVDHRTDIYSLGATLYELATGRPLFEADSPHAVITQILTTEPPRPRVVCPNLPRDFETIILKCLAKEPSQRYATAQALADDLRAFVEGRAIRARRATLAEQAARWFKQQKRSVGVAAAAVAATIFVVIGSLIAWQMHGQAQLGYLTLETPRDGNERAEVAEVLTLNDEPVGSPFTLPTKEPLPIPAGRYRLRLTAPSKVSQDYLFDVAAGQQMKFDVGLVNETVGHALPLKSPVGAEIVQSSRHVPRDEPFGTRSRTLPEALEGQPKKSHHVERDGYIPRLFVGPQDSSRPAMRCYSVRSQPTERVASDTAGANELSGRTELRPLWESDWRLEAPGIVSFLKLPEDKEAWKELTKQWDVAAWQQVLAWFDPYWLHNGTPPRVLQAMHDLNGDGTEDAIWVAPRRAHQQSGAFGPGPLTPKAAVLLAVSGKDGQPLWWFRPQDAKGSACRIVCDPIQCGSVAVMALRSSETGDVWIEGADTTSGNSLWRSKSLFVVPQSSVWLVPMTLSDGVSGVVVAGGTRMFVLEAQTGTVRPAPTSRAPASGDAGNRLAFRDNEPILDARFGDFDGNGTLEAILTVQTSERGIRDMAVSLADGKALWELPSSYEVGAFHQNEARHSWPLLADLDNDGRLEAIVPGERESGSMVSDGCRVLDAMTGELRWKRRFPRRGGFSHRKPEQITIGPDLDGDGQREVFMASIRSEYGPRQVGQIAAHHYEEHFLYVDSFSGRDGRSLWWQRAPLGLTEYAAITGDIGEMLWWQSSPVAPRPESGTGTDSQSSTANSKSIDRSAVLSQSDTATLVIPVHRHPDTQEDGGTHSIYVLSAATGRVEHQADDLAFPRVVDWNDDGLDDLAVFAPDDPTRFASHSYWPPPVSGKFVVLRGTPPEAFRRLDRWVEEQDFDGDGIAELSHPIGGMGIDYAVQIASGRDGHILSSWKVEWPETPRSWTVGELHSFPSPLGDFDGDGLADLLLTREGHFYDFDPKSLLQTGRIPLLMQGVSGKSGKAVWRGGSFPLPDWCRPTVVDERSSEWQQLRNSNLKHRIIQAVDTDGDNRSELLLIWGLSTQRPYDTNAWQLNLWHQLFVGLVDAGDGSLRWVEPLAQPLIGNHHYLNTERGLRLDASTDLDGDGTRDVLLFVPNRTPEGLWTGTLQAHNGRDGKKLWPERAIHGKWFNDDGLKRPLIGDLDADGKPEIVLLSSKEPLTVRAFRGETGEELWKWTGAISPNFSDPSVVIIQSSPVAPRQESRTSNDADRANDIETTKDANPTPGNSSRGARRLQNGERRCVAVTVNETGNQWELVLLDHAGQVVERQPSGAIQIWSHDLDGDGLEELLRPGNNKLTASRGLHDTLWEWSHPAEFGYGYVSRFDRDSEGRVIVVGASGDSLALLDGPTGRPLGRTFKSTNTSLTENNRGVDLNHANIATPFENSRLLTRVGDGPVMLNHIVSRAVLPTDADGRYRGVEETERTEGSGRAEKSSTGTLSSQRSLSSFPQRNDPRLIRQLPWAPSQAEWAAGKMTMLAQVGLAVVLAFVVILIPFWMIRAGVRRKELGWWRVALIVSGAAVFATSVMVFRFTPPGAIWRDAPWGIPIVIGVAALPGLMWVATLVRNLFTGEWRRLCWLLGGSLVAALALAMFILWQTAAQKPPEQHYSWHAWWLILLFGAHAIGALLVLWKLFAPGTLWLWRKFRKPQTPSSLKPISP